MTGELTAFPRILWREPEGWPLGRLVMMLNEARALHDAYQGGDAEDGSLPDNSLMVAETAAPEDAWAALMELLKAGERLDAELRYCDRLFGASYQGDNVSQWRRPRIGVAMRLLVQAARHQADMLALWSMAAEREAGRKDEAAGHLIEGRAYVAPDGWVIEKHAMHGRADSRP
ncbi:MAG: hypothetical protein DI601_25720 [Azospirillum brasilense]|nr:MAG: hypothetical protein DI601_25720 [Azospirillum brasilense]